LVYGYEVTVGKAEIDPFKFSFRYLFSMFFVYYAPYVVQDILNLNNEIVDTIGNYGMKMGGITVNVATILPMSFIGFVKSIGDLVDSGQGLKGLATILIMLIVLIMVFIPLLKLVVWWYVRLFKIFLYTALSPLMFASLCIENTAKTGFNFLRNFVQEVFGQLFLVIALFVTGAFIAQLPTLSANSNIGIIGVGIALYAALSFLHEVPALANGLLDGSSISRYGARVSDGVGAIRSSLGRHSSNLVPRNMRAAYQKSSVGRAANFAKDRIGNHQLGSNKKIESVLKSQAKSSKQLRKSFNK
jgi:hypothetical protein